MTKPSKDRPLLRKRAEQLDAEQQRRRIPLSRRVYLCPNCGTRMTIRTSRESYSVAYCNRPGCKTSKKIGRNTHALNDAELTNLRAENQALREQLNGHNAPNVGLNGHSLTPKS